MDGLYGLSFKFDWKYDTYNVSHFGKKYNINDELVIHVRPVVYGNCFSFKYIKPAYRNLTLAIYVSYYYLRNRKQMGLFIHDEADAIGKHLNVPTNYSHFVCDLLHSQV